MTLPRDDGATPPGRTGLLLVNLGTPDAPTAAAVRRYLAQFLLDRRVVDAPRWWWWPLLMFGILPWRAPRVARKYAAIWRPDGSPLLALSRNLAAGLQQALPELEVLLAMRYGTPSIESALQAMHARGLARLLVLPLYPQYSATTTASVFDAVADALADRPRVPELRVIADYHQDSGWLDALEASVRTHWDLRGRGERLLVSLHGIPQRYADAGDPYPQQCEAGARALAARLQLGPEQWALAYQSRFGREPWLGPGTEATLAAWAAAGVRTVDVICPGFAVDCLETLEEIGVEAAAAFARAGGTLRYIPALNDGPGHVAALAALARRHLAGWPA
jgi:ferrochelatase